MEYAEYTDKYAEHIKHIELTLPTMLSGKLVLLAGLAAVLVTYRDGPRHATAGAVLPLPRTSL